MRRSAPILALVVLAIGLVAPSAAFAGSVLPAGFRAQSISFVSPQDGWILGVGNCGQTTCTTVLGTTNGGGVWGVVGTINAPLTYDRIGGVTGIRMADDLHGWAFGPSLWATADGGHTWHKQPIPGGGRMVPVLAADADGVYALVSTCRLNQTPSSCTPATLWKTTPDGTTFTKTRLKLRAGLVTNTARMSMHDNVAYLIVPAETGAEVVKVTTDGTTWKSRPDPCTAPDEEIADVTAVSDTEVGILCIGDPGFSQSTKHMYKSNNTGQTDTRFGAISRSGIVSQLTATPGGRFLLTSWGAEGSWIYRSNGGGPWTEPVGLNDGGEGWNDVTMVSNSVGFVVHGPAALFPGNRAGQLAETTNRGVTWTPVS
jgi:hypothetical protein